jgi:hypothetical protein
MENIIFKSMNIYICVSDTANEESKNLIENTSFGNKGFKYQHAGVRDKIVNLKNPTFFYLYSDNTLIGFYGLCRRKVNFLSLKNVDAFYGRYLTIIPNYYQQGYGKLLKKEAIKYIESHYENPIFYSYIEQNNIHSLQISKNEGFLSKALIKSLVFFRFFPRKSSHVSIIQPHELPKIKTLLNSSYQKHSLFLLENIGYQGNYFVYKENEEIIAGIQANPVLWNILKIEGILGKMLKIIKYIPLLNKIISEKYKFLAIEGVYIKETHEQSDVLYRLLEGVLAHFQYNSALLQLDETDKLAIKINSEKKLGLLSKLNHPVTTHLMVKASNIALPNECVYISSFDFT